MKHLKLFETFEAADLYYRSFGKSWNSFYTDCKKILGEVVTFPDVAEMYPCAWTYIINGGSDKNQFKKNCKNHDILETHNWDDLINKYPEVNKASYDYDFLFYRLLTYRGEDALTAHRPLISIEDKFDKPDKYNQIIYFLSNKKLHETWSPNWIDI